MKLSIQWMILSLLAFAYLIVSLWFVWQAKVFLGVWNGVFLVGKWSVETFSLSSFLFLAYLFLLGCFVLNRALSWAVFQVFLFSLLPFFTLTAFFHLLLTNSSQLGPLTQFLQILLGDTGAPIFVLLALILECWLFYYFLVYNWGSQIFKPTSSAVFEETTGKQDTRSSKDRDKETFLPILSTQFTPPMEVASLGSDSTRFSLQNPDVKSPDAYQELLEKRQEMLLELDHLHHRKTATADSLKTTDNALLEDQSLYVDNRASYKKVLKHQVQEIIGKAQMKPTVEENLGVTLLDPQENSESILDWTVIKGIDKSTSDTDSDAISDSMYTTERNKHENNEQEIAEDAKILQNTLKEFKIEAQIVGLKRGPSVTRIEILPAEGVRLSKIVNLSDNIALRLAAKDVRIVAPIPGKRAVGIEIPNRRRDLVSFEILVQKENQQEKALKSLPVLLGKDLEGQSVWIDLTSTPHLLIAGATGSGKSVCVNSLISSLLNTCTPGELKFLMIDPKIVELNLYNGVPHLLTPVINDAKKALQALQWALYEMERRYNLLDAHSARDITSYNSKQEHMPLNKLPYIVVIIDEFADLMNTAGKDLENNVARLAAMARAVGIHLVLATQRPSIDVITGLIKANFPSRIAFMVASKFDSRVILDAVGAEKLLGKGDLLYMSSSSSEHSRIQGAFLGEDQVKALVNKVITLHGNAQYVDQEIFFDEEGESLQGLALEDDPLLEVATEIVQASGKASTSYLQRRLKVGYSRAARLIDILEDKGYIGPANGSKPRDVF